MFYYLIFSLFNLFISQPPLAGGFAKHSPIIWETSNSNMVAKGYFDIRKFNIFHVLYYNYFYRMGTVYNTVNYDSPCHYLMLSKQQSKSLIYKCETDFRNFFEEPLKVSNVCPLFFSKT